MGTAKTQTLYERKIIGILRNKTTIGGFLGYFYTKIDPLFRGV